MAESSFQVVPGSTAPDAPAVFRGEVEFHQLLDKVPAAAYTCDSDGLITYYNRQAAQLWGREPKLCDETDRYCGSFRLWWPDGSPMPHERCWMARALELGEAFDGEEVVIERADGRRVTALAHANPLRDREGSMVGAVNVLIDITERKTVEQYLKDADRAKDEFLATLAHELRNPLAPIRNALEIMKLAADDVETAVRAREMIERQVDQMTRLVDDLLDVSRIAGNKLILRRERIDLVTLIEEVAETAGARIESQGRTLELSLPPEPIPVEADPVRLTQVLSNLLDNAVKYGRPGGRIWLAAERRDGRVEIRVRDEGRGIPADMLTRIFEPFIQLDQSLERTQAGLGIGLMLVRKLVELHGGEVEARSDGPDRGSEFTVRLPIDDAAPLPAGRDETAAAERAAAPPHRVLVVDDNRDAATSLATLLELSGHDVHTVHDGEAAVAAAAELRPEVVLLDIAMPKLNGYEAARRIRARPWGRDLTLIAMTGYGQEADVRRSREAGFDHHLVKPIDVAALRRLLAANGDGPDAGA